MPIFSADLGIFKTTAKTLLSCLINTIKEIYWFSAFTNYTLGPRRYVHWFSTVFRKGLGYHINNNLILNLISFHLILILDYKIVFKTIVVLLHVYLVLRQGNVRQNFTRKFPETFGTKVWIFLRKLSPESFVEISPEILRKFHITCTKLNILPLK